MIVLRLFRTENISLLLIPVDSPFMLFFCCFCLPGSLGCLWKHWRAQLYIIDEETKALVNAYPANSPCHCGNFSNRAVCKSKCKRISHNPSMPQDTDQITFFFSEQKYLIMRFNYKQTVQLWRKCSQHCLCIYYAKTRNPPQAWNPLENNGEEGQLWPGQCSWIFWGDGQTRGLEKLTCNMDNRSQAFYVTEESPNLSYSGKLCRTE